MSCRAPSFLVRPFPKIVTTIQLVLLLALVVAVPAQAQEILFHHGFALFNDDDASGGLSCGDRVRMGVDLMVGALLGLAMRRLRRRVGEGVVS